MLTGICEMTENRVADPDVRVILLKGYGKIFSAGVDFNSLMEAKIKTQGENAHVTANYRSGGHRICSL
jgi:enoyl-CoA hydratase/carnithine racemase